MQFADYAAFREAVQILIDGDDISTSDLSVATLDLMIGAGEIRVYRDIRSSTQDTALALTTASNKATLPADFIELKGAPYVANFVTAVYAPWEALQNQLQIIGESRSNAYFYSFEGDALIFYPSLQDGTAISGRYYKKFDDISTGLNALFNRHPDVFLYAALVESAPFLGEQARMPIWQDRYQTLIAAANESERRRITRGSKLATRVA